MGNTNARSQTAGTEAVGDRTDGWLLERFAVQRDEAAFAALVQRYGPLVLSACRRVLQHEQDAEDAFQATFLVLARKAPQLCQSKTVGRWLCSVAYRIAKKARCSKVRRQVRETELEDIVEPERTPEWVWRDLQHVVHEEIDRLPLVYRQPFVLCCLQGKTNEQAAQQLGCPLGTVLSRLARARARLRSRLSRRGVALSTGLLATLLAEQAASATVPATLSDATVRAAVLFAGRQPMTTGMISPQVVTLAKRFLKTSAQNQSKVGALALLALGVGLATLLALFLGLSAQRPLRDLKDAEPAEQGAEAHLAERKRFEGTWRVLSAEIARRRLPFNNLRVSITGDRWRPIEQPAPASFTMFRYDETKGPKTPAQRNVFVLDPTISYTYDATKDPKTIDLTFPGGQLALGIYGFEGDRMKLCYRLAGQGRPTEYATTPGGQTLLFHFQREPMSAFRPRFPQGAPGNDFSR
jgi:RNA polymerase sigma factor (sigma-70 family)